MSSFDPSQFTFPCNMGALGAAAQQFAKAENSTGAILQQFQGLHGDVVPSTWQGTASQMAGASFEALGNAVVPLMQYASSGSALLSALESTLEPLYSEFQSLIAQGEDASAFSTLPLLAPFAALAAPATAAAAVETSQQISQITSKLETICQEASAALSSSSAQLNALAPHTAVVPGFGPSPLAILIAADPVALSAATSAGMPPVGAETEIGDGPQYAVYLATLAAEQGWHSSNFANQGQDGSQWSDPNEEWCADFATWVWMKSGVNVPDIPSVSNLYTWGQQHNLLTTTPQPGDLALWGNGAHVSIVTAVNPDGTITTVNGDDYTQGAYPGPDNAWTIQGTSVPSTGAAGGSQPTPEPGGLWTYLAFPGSAG